ncbi:hypothetical protein [Spirosoma flavum]|uniref:Uncharacterized protein n=1 Tax=Spirosoma flavum TaxID=2048557 RepID=A0ABW6AMB5_9BACT
MNEFTHIRMIMGFILSLSVAQLLRGVAKLIVHPTRSRPYWVHLMWVVYIFLAIIYFWWWEYRLHELTQWTFLSYVGVIFYIVLYYLLCSLLFPEDLSDYEGFKDYYYARRPWFFSILATTFLMDVVDTMIKGSIYFKNLGPEYPIRIGIHIVLCLLAVKWRNERYHAGLVFVLLGYNISWIARHYFVE